MYATMRAIGKHIVVTPLHEEVKTSSGLVMDGDEMRYHRAEVVLAGSDVIGVHPGEVIYFDKHSGHTARIDDVTYTVILERDVVVCV